MEKGSSFLQLLHLTSRWGPIDRFLGLLRKVCSNFWLYCIRHIVDVQIDRLLGPLNGGRTCFKNDCIGRVVDVQSNKLIGSRNEARSPFKNDDIGRVFDVVNEKTDSIFSKNCNLDSQTWNFSKSGHKINCCLIRICLLWFFILFNDHQNKIILKCFIFSFHIKTVTL